MKKYKARVLVIKFSNIRLNIKPSFDFYKKKKKKPKQNLVLTQSKDLNKMF